MYVLDDLAEFGSLLVLFVCISKMDLKIGKIDPHQIINPSERSDQYNIFPYYDPPPPISTAQVRAISHQLIFINRLIKLNLPHKKSLIIQNLWNCKTRKQKMSRPRLFKTGNFKRCPDRDFFRPRHSDDVEPKTSRDWTKVSACTIGSSSCSQYFCYSEHTHIFPDWNQLSGFYCGNLNEVPAT